MEQDDIFMKNVQEVIQNNIKSPKLKGDFIAAQLGMSRMQLHRKLKAVTKQHARAYITTIRIEHAKRQLKNTSKFTYQISIECGFKHYTHFSKLFKKHTGFSPSEYRKK